MKKYAVYFNGFEVSTVKADLPKEAQKKAKQLAQGMKSTMPFLSNFKVKVIQMGK